MILDTTSLDNFFTSDGVKVYPIEEKGIIESQTKLKNLNNSKQEIISMNSVVRQIEKALFDGQQEFKKEHDEKNKTLKLI